MLVISVPLSETIVLGFLRLAMRLSNSRASRAPDTRSVELADLEGAKNGITLFSVGS